MEEPKNNPPDLQDPGILDYIIEKIFGGSRPGYYNIPNKNEKRQIDEINKDQGDNPEQEPTFADKLKELFKMKKTETEGE